MNEKYKIDIRLDDNSLVLTSETVSISYCNSLDRQLVKAIYQLQQENKELKEQLENASNNYTKYIQERDNKIDKAIEYMNGEEFFLLMNSIQTSDKAVCEDYFKAKGKLLEILKDSDVDE